MEGQTVASEFDYKSILARYIQVVANTEGVHFIDECSTSTRERSLQFSQAEIDEMFRLFDEFDYDLGAIR
ncbi:hypothetical protein GCM10028825_06240 [Spirosoma agri]